MGIDDIAVGFFFPIPNTQLYHELIESGRISLNDEFLLTPIFANEEKLLPENNYCDQLSARQVTWWKYKILLNFYLTSFATRPWRVLSIIFNALRGKETRKMETFLVDIRRKVGIAIKNKFRRGGDRSDGDCPVGPGDGLGSGSTAARAHPLTIGGMEESFVGADQILIHHLPEGHVGGLHTQTLATRHDRRQLLVTAGGEGLADTIVLDHDLQERHATVAALLTEERLGDHHAQALGEAFAKPGLRFFVPRTK